MYAQMCARENGGLSYPRSLDRGRQRQLQLYRRARERGRRGQFWSRLTGRPRCLLDLASVEANCRVQARGDAALRTVSIDQICGSESRARDYDRDFNPLKDYTRERWLGIAAARERGDALPPVLLDQVGDIYFVRDGHHRISVALALGQKAIEAKVVVWQVEGSLPWETSTCGPGCEPGGQPGRLRREGARLQDRVLPSARGVMATVRGALHFWPTAAAR
jgi:hypothetical protein